MTCTAEVAGKLAVTEALGAVSKERDGTPTMAARFAELLGAMTPAAPEQNPQGCSPSQKPLPKNVSKN